MPHPDAVCLGSAGSHQRAEHACTTRTAAAHACGTALTRAAAAIRSDSTSTLGSADQRDDLALLRSEVTRLAEQNATLAAQLEANPSKPPRKACLLQADMLSPLCTEQLLPCLISCSMTGPCFMQGHGITPQCCLGSA